MNRIYKCKSNRVTCSPVREPNEIPTKSGLAYTPAQMFELSKRGIPIAAGNVSLQFETGHDAKSFDVPLERVRGVDVATMWEHSQQLKLRVQNKYISKKKELL